ncbi:GDP-L-fucose synthase family protein [Alkalitalea saponilacus]|uniref:GDP-L-fucose synthase n=1 Tax=Alkalitalea saponilacus TaxID=889453 RepID=A0A1T5HBB9_9BACT|nr:GDP-L-fucose synthase [Alkalitalea saponilacus]ASB50771.1 GDP-fucose synthetase [Alkalitalea saponilacus]SKC17978.1 GDP-L-fucose synthase [Alkalitalea saponilacus]
MQKSDRIYIAGHKGLVGSAITRHLQNAGYLNLILPERSELDLINQKEVDDFFTKEKPDYVFLAAAKVGGIMANNTYRADFIYENLQIQNNIIHAAWKSKVKKLLFLGSSCIYPRDCPQPMKEEYLLTAPLEYTNEPYAVAKIAGMKMCESYNLQYGTDFISVMPTNLYGPNDNYNLHGSHVLPALIRKMHLAQCLVENNFNGIREDLKARPMVGIEPGLSDEMLQKSLQEFGIFKENNKVEVRLWGSGKPRREFLHSDDLAEAVIFVMNNISFADVVKERGEKEVRNTHLNIGFGEDLSISELAEMVKEVVGYSGAINWDASKPDGTFRKLMDVSRLNQLGWKARINLTDGIREVYKAYCNPS